jgi:hypothetical protein
MSKQSRARKKNKRDAEKRRKKAANKAQYAAWRDQGINQKSQRAKANKVKNRKVRRVNSRVRTKRMSTLKKNDGSLLSWSQTHNQMSWEQFKK